MLLLYRPLGPQGHCFRWLILNTKKFQPSEFDKRINLNSSQFGKTCIEAPSKSPLRYCRLHRAQYAELKYLAPARSPPYSHVPVVVPYCIPGACKSEPRSSVNWLSYPTLPKKRFVSLLGFTTTLVELHWWFRHHQPSCFWNVYFPNASLEMIHNIITHEGVENCTCIVHSSEMRIPIIEFVEAMTTFELHDPKIKSRFVKSACQFANVHLWFQLHYDVLMRGSFSDSCVRHRVVCTSRFRFARVD